MNEKNIDDLCEKDNKKNKHVWSSDEDHNTIKLIYDDTSKLSNMPAPLPCAVKSEYFETISDDTFNYIKSCIENKKDLCNEYTHFEKGESSKLKKDNDTLESKGDTLNDNKKYLKNFNENKFDTSNSKFIEIDIDEYIKDYKKIISDTTKNDKDKTITTEFKKLTEQGYWDEGTYAINTSIQKGKKELYDILKLKLPENHEFLKILNTDDYVKINSDNMFNEIRNNTIKFIGNDDGLIKHIDKKFGTKLLLLEIQLYLDQLDEGKTIPDSIITDKDLHILYPEQIKRIVNQYETNYEFRSCVNDQISPEERDIIKRHSDKKLTELSEKDFVEYSDTLEDILTHIKEMNSHTMYACMERVINPSDICDGELIEEYLQLLMVFFQFININTNLKSKDTNKVNRIVEKTFPQMKAIFKNLIEYSRAHPSCNTKSKNKLKMYDKIYKQLFEKDKAQISYNLFENVNWDNNFFTDFTNTIYGKIILLVFIAFIFSKLVSLFSSSPPEVVAPK